MSAETGDTGRPVRLDGTSLTLEELVRVARGGSVRSGIDPEVAERMRRSRRVVEEVLAGDRPVYGVNTGFGKLSDVRVDRDRLRELQVNLVRSHACGVGDPLEPEEVRALMTLRANVLLRGCSGVRPDVPRLLLEMLEADVLPRVPRKGSVGASGDLAPAAHVALVVIGEGEVLTGSGERLGGSEALREAGLEPLALEAKEGLALLNGTQGMTALGALAVHRAEELVELADLAGALSLDGLRGTPDAFDPVVGALRPHEGQRTSARRLRALMRGSEIRESHRQGDPRVQDAYSLRCMPQVHGAAADAVAHVRGVLDVELNAVTDNPLVVADREGEPRVVSNGNFHGQPVATALDHLTTALATLAGISERRIDRLLNPDLSGLPAFLTPEPGLRSGMMMMQVTAAAQVVECRQLARPASVESIPTGAAKEDHVSMGMHAAEQARGAVRCVERILAMELLAAAQAVEHLRPLRSSPALERAVEAVRAVSPPLEEDRPLADDIEAVVELLRGRELSEVVRAAGTDGGR